MDSLDLRCGYRGPYYVTDNDNFNVEVYFSSRKGSLIFYAVLTTTLPDLYALFLCRSRDQFQLKRIIVAELPCCFFIQSMVHLSSVYNDFQGLF